MLAGLRAGALQRLNAIGDYAGMPERCITDYLITQWIRPFIYYSFATRIDNSPKIEAKKLTYIAAGQECSVENIRLPTSGHSQKIEDTNYELYNSGMQGLPRYEVIELNNPGVQSRKQLDRLERRGVIAKVVLTILYVLFCWSALFRIMPTRHIRAFR